MRWAHLIPIFIYPILSPHSVHSVQPKVSWVTFISQYQYFSFYVNVNNNNIIIILTIY